MANAIYRLDVDVRADIAVVGGTGLSSLLPDGKCLEIATPYGSPSSPVRIHEVDGVRVAFLARHGRQHEFPAHRVPFRANLWALASLGVRSVLAPCAVGSLREQLPPGCVVVPDQLVDRTHGRESTFFDDCAHHVSFADPYCPGLRTAAIAEAIATSVPHHDGGVLVVIPGPRFGTRAEAEWYRQVGGDLVNMTAMPEAALARELELCYCNLAMVTDYDAGIGARDPVTQADVMRQVAESMGTVRDLVLGVIRRVGSDSHCDSARH